MPALERRLARVVQDPPGRAPVNHSPNLWIVIYDGLVEEVQADRTVQFVDEQGLFVFRKNVKWEAPGFAETFR
jgi:hypothetical protein